LRDATLLQFSSDSCWRGIRCKNVTLSRYGKAPRRYREISASTADARVGDVSYDATNIACEDAAYDIVVACQVLSSIEDDVLAFNEIMRVLSHEGIFVFTLPVDWTAEKTQRVDDFEATANVRMYGCDIASRFRGAGEYVILAVKGFDLIEAASHTAFVAVRSKERAKEVRATLESSGQFIIIDC